MQSSPCVSFVQRVPSGGAARAVLAKSKARIVEDLISIVSVVLIVDDLSETKYSEVEVERLSKHEKQQPVICYIAPSDV
jgi:hypothetical protein